MMPSATCIKIDGTQQGFTGISSTFWLDRDLAWKFAGFITTSPSSSAWYIEAGRLSRIDVSIEALLGQHHALVNVIADYGFDVVLKISYTRQHCTKDSLAHHLPFANSSRHPCSHKSSFCTRSPICASTSCSSLLCRLSADLSSLISLKT